MEGFEWGAFSGWGVDASTKKAASSPLRVFSSICVPKFGHYSVR